MGLTSLATESAQPKEKLYRIFDGSGYGLYLEVLPHGTKKWRLKYRYGGRYRSITLGTYPETDLEEARSKAIEQKKLLKSNIDPLTKRKEEKAQNQERYHFESITKRMKRIFICSPYAGNVEANVELARKLCQKAIKAGYAPFAPHLHYPGIVDDTKEEERDTGIACGLSFMAICDEVWAYAENAQKASPGMRQELIYASVVGVRVKFIKSL